MRNDSQDLFAYVNGLLRPFIEQAVLERNTRQSDCKFVSNTDPAGRCLMVEQLLVPQQAYPFSR